MKPISWATARGCSRSVSSSGLLAAPGPSRPCSPRTARSRPCRGAATDRPARAAPPITNGIRQPQLVELVVAQRCRRAARRAATRSAPPSRWRCRRTTSSGRAARAARSRPGTPKRWTPRHPATCPGRCARGAAGSVPASRPADVRRQDRDHQRPAGHQRDGQHHRLLAAAQVGEAAEQHAAERPEEEGERVGREGADERQRLVAAEEKIWVAK